MTHRVQGWILGLVVAGLVCLPRPAYADGYVNAGFGINFANSAVDTRPNFVADVGWLSRQPVGAEVDFTFAPRFIRDGSGLAENRLTTVMANVLVAGFDRDRRGGRRRDHFVVRPFASVGVGLMAESLDVSNQHLGFNAGVGIMALSRRALGIRAEIRYFQDLVGSGTSDGINFGSFHFVRASVGLVGTF